MQISMQPRLINKVRGAAAISLLALGFLTQTATAQTAAPAATKPSATAPTNAQLQAQIRELREEVLELQKAQNASIENAATDAAGKSKDSLTARQPKDRDHSMPMPDSAGTKTPTDKGMAPSGMGDRDKHDSMKKPAANADAPKDPPMKSGCCG